MAMTKLWTNIKTRELGHFLSRLCSTQLLCPQKEGRRKDECCDLYIRFEQIRVIGSWNKRKFIVVIARIFKRRWFFFKTWLFFLYLVSWTDKELTNSLSKAHNWLQNVSRRLFTFICRQRTNKMTCTWFWLVEQHTSVWFALTKMI